MKIDDVKVGEEYAANQWVKVERIGRDSVEVRRVKVLAVDVVQERGRYGAVGRKVRRLRVRFIDESPSSYTGTWPNHVKGAETTIPARVLLGPWDEIAIEVAREKAARERQAKRHAELVERFAEIGIEPLDVSVRRLRDQVDVSLTDEQIERLLRLAERIVAREEP